MERSVSRSAARRWLHVSRFCLGVLGLTALTAITAPAQEEEHPAPQKLKTTAPQPAAQPATPAQPAAPAPPATETLYKRLGGYDAIAGVVDDFLARLAGDPSLGRFFVGFSNDSKRRIRQLIVDQLCQATGGPCYYIGRSMKASHAGLGITEADWTASVNHLVATFDKFQVPQRERDEVLAAVTALKAEIVTAK